MKAGHACSAHSCAAIDLYVCVCVATLVIIAAFSLGEKCDRRRGQVERESTLNCRKSILIARAGQLQQFHPAFRKVRTVFKYSDSLYCDT